MKRRGNNCKIQTGTNSIVNKLLREQSIRYWKTVVIVRNINMLKLYMIYMFISINYIKNILIKSILTTITQSTIEKYFHLFFFSHIKVIINHYYHLVTRNFIPNT